MLDALPTRVEREPVLRLGQGGDDTTAIDEAAELAVVARLVELGQDFVLVSEELGERTFGSGGPTRVVVDPVDGSVNAKRGIPFFSFSLAVAEGGTMDDVGFGYVYDFGTGEEWTAERGRGAFLDGAPLEAPPPKDEVEILSFEGTTTQAIAARIDGLLGLAGRIRVMGSLALSLCHLAAGRVDAVCSLKEARSVDIAAAQLLVRERGLAIELVDDPPFSAAPLDLVTRSRVVAAGSDALVAAVAGALRRLAPDDVRPRAERRIDRLPGRVAEAEEDPPGAIRVEHRRHGDSEGEVLRRQEQRAVVRLHSGDGRAEREAGVRRNRGRVDARLPGEDGGVREAKRAVEDIGRLDRVGREHRRGEDAGEVAACGDALDRPRRPLRAGWASRDLARLEVAHEQRVILDLGPGHGPVAEVNRADRVPWQDDSRDGLLRRLAERCHAEERDRERDDGQHERDPGHVSLIRLPRPGSSQVRSKP